MAVAVEVSKEFQRKETLILRKKIIDKGAKEKQILVNILANEIVQKSENILLYLSLRDEVSTWNLLEELWKLGKNIYVPKVEDKNMEFYKISSKEELKIGKFNIFEPTTSLKYLNEKKDCIIVPGLLFDKFGNRLGYGKGYYDRYLEKKNLYKIGICFSTFLVDKINVLKHDIKMDLIICEVPNGVYKISKIDR